MSDKQEVRRLNWIIGHVEQLSPPSRDWLVERLKADRAKAAVSPPSLPREEE